MTKDKKMTRPFIRLISDNNIKKFKDYIHCVDWDSLLTREDCDKDYSTFIEVLTLGYEKCFPYVKLSCKRPKDKKWITKGLKISSNTKNRLYRNLKNKHSHAKEAKYFKYKNLYIKLCATAEVNFYHEILKDTKKSLRKLWDTFRPIINPDKANKKSNINKLIQGRDIITDNISICNNFNDYFVDIGKKLTENIPKNNNFLKYLGNKNPQTMFLRPTDKTEVLKIISKLDNKKASGPDLIKVTLVKSCSDNLSEPLTMIINCSFSTSIFLEMLKQAKVIPIHKKEKYLVGNYRPISLLSIFGKIFEKTMHIQLYSFITKYKILYDLQFGFRNNDSTTLATIDIVERIRGTLDKGEKVLGINLDLQKAFNTVDHHIIIQKLIHYGIRGKCLSWFSSYLSGRSQFVSVNNAQSQCKSINIGVPQGSVLGPVLFLLYINDIANFTLNTDITIMFFADDTSYLGLKHY